MLGTVKFHLKAAKEELPKTSETSMALLCQQAMLVLAVLMVVYTKMRGAIWTADKTVFSNIWLVLCRLCSCSTTMGEVALTRMMIGRLTNSVVLCCTRSSL